MERLAEVVDDPAAAGSEGTPFGKGPPRRRTTIRLLLVEDNPHDATLITRAVKHAGYEVSWDRVDTAAALEAALRQTWDLITCDWIMAGFGGPAALELLGTRNVDAPVIVVSGEPVERVIVTAMKMGAHDFVSKENLAHLVPVAERELRVAEARRAQRLAAAALNASEARYRRLFETAKDGIFILDAATGHIIDVNPFLVQLLGYDRKDLVGRELWELGPFRDIAASRDAFRDLQAKEYIRYEHLPLESRDGRRTDVEFVSNAYDVDGERVIQCNVRDITERKRADATASARYAEVERQLQERTAAAAALATKLETISYAVSRHLPATLRHIEDFSELLKEEHAAQLDSLGRQYVDGIQADARRVRNLIAELLRFSPV